MATSQPGPFPCRAIRNRPARTRQAQQRASGPAGAAGAASGGGPAGGDGPAGGGGLAGGDGPAGAAAGASGRHFAPLEAANRFRAAGGSEFRVFLVYTAFGGAKSILKAVAGAGRAVECFWRREIDIESRCRRRACCRVLLAARNCWRGLSLAACGLRLSLAACGWQPAPDAGRGSRFLHDRDCGESAQGELGIWKRRPFGAPHELRLLGGRVLGVCILFESSRNVLGNRSLFAGSQRLAAGSRLILIGRGHARRGGCQWICSRWSAMMCGRWLGIGY